jgi:hypothetical protein
VVSLALLLSGRILIGLAWLFQREAFLAFFDALSS